MNDLRTAAQQALEALEYAGMDVGKFNRVNAACTALRAALAQQTLNAPEECEHKADGWYAVQRVAGVTRVWPMTEAQALRAALAQQDEPMREPDDGVCDGLRGGLCIHQDPNQCDRQRDCPASQQAEPVQEPVATLGYARKIERLIAQRDDLLQAVKKIRSFTVDGAMVYAAMIDINSVASRAIKAAEAKE